MIILKQSLTGIETMNKPTIQFKAGSPMMVIGPTNCGKTQWIYKLLKNDMFTEKVSSILICYGVYQKFYNVMKDTISTPISFNEGLPTKEIISNMSNGKFHIIVLDDLMEEIVKSTSMQELFTKYCHHNNITAIMVSQNIFQKGPCARTISLNSHIQVLFANKRDESQIAILARQLYRSPEKKKKFLQVYDTHMKHRYEYLVIDCTPDMPVEIKVRTHIFPGETTYTFDI